MARRSTLPALAVAIAIAAAPASPQDDPAPPSPSSSASENEDTITVVGRRGDGITLRDYAMDFVLELADPATPRNGYATWGRRICVGVENAPEDGAQFIADRIGEVATELGLRAGGPGCTPNVVISFALDGQALAQAMVEQQPLRFRPFGGYGGTTQGLQSLDDFASSDAAVRWWQVTMIVDWMGNPAITLTGQPQGPTVVAGANSLLRQSVEDQLWTETIIVDARKVSALSWRQLADYLAMITLAQIDPKGSSAGYDTILNLFDDGGAVQGLTDWDWSYLRGLYELDRRLTPHQQRGTLAGLIAREQQKVEEE